MVSLSIAFSSFPGQPGVETVITLYPGHWKELWNGMGAKKSVAIL